MLSSAPDSDGGWLVGWLGFNGTFNTEQRRWTAGSLTTCVFGKLLHCTGCKLTSKTVINVVHLHTSNCSSTSSNVYLLSRPATGQQYVHDTSDGPDVHLVAVTATLYDFWCDVVGRATDRPASTDNSSQNI